MKISYPNDAVSIEIHGSFSMMIDDALTKPCPSVSFTFMVLELVLAAHIGAYVVEDSLKSIS